MTFPEWLSGTEPLLHTPGAVHPSCCVWSVFACTCSFAGLIRQMPPPKFSDTAITNLHSDTTIFQLRAHWVRIGSEKLLGRAPSGSRTLDFLHARQAPYPLGKALLSLSRHNFGIYAWISKYLAQLFIWNIFSGKLVKITLDGQTIKWSLAICQSR